MILGMTIGAFIAGILVPAGVVVFSLILAITGAYEGKKAEKLGEDFDYWYYTF